MLISTEDAAVELGITRRRVNALITAGRLHAVRVGRAWVIERSALRAVRHRQPGRPAPQAKVKGR